MAAVPMTFVGIATGDDGRSGNVTLVGMASITGLGVGGGPILPDKPPVDPDPPHVEHPIVLPDPPHVEHPIVLPDPPIPPDGPPTDPPHVSWVWGFTPQYGWHPVYVPGPTDPQPHAT